MHTLEAGKTFKEVLELNLVIKREIIMVEGCVFGFCICFDKSGSWEG